MAKYPVANDPADNASLLQKYREGQGLPLRTAYVKENMIATGELWIMQNTESNAARYMSLFDSEDIPTTNVEALERAGATFYPHCTYCNDVCKSANQQIQGHKCEIIRHCRSPTMTTDIAFGKRERTMENVLLAEKELDDNALDLEIGQILEERKTLRWLKEELQQDNGLESQHVAGT